MTKRAKKLIEQTYGANIQPAIAALVEFAAQNSGIETGNYFNPADLREGRRQVFFDGQRAYRQEVRSIGADWKRFKETLAVCAVEGVTDKEVIAAAPSAYSGRLTWEPCGKQGEPDRGHVWNYCTGQYFPTEYRKAAATVLDYALRQVRQARPAEKRQIGSIAELKALNEQNGGCWFGRGEMRFFGTKIESGIIRGRYFISSEQPPHGPRAFTVRTFDEAGSVDTVGEFCSHASKAAAIASIPAAQQIAA